MAPKKPAATREPIQMIQEALPSVAFVSVRSKRGNSSGSAFAVKLPAAQIKKVGGQLLVTNAHVVKDGKSLTVRYTNGFDQPASLLLKDPRLDIALMKVEEKPKKPLELRDTATVKLGEPVWAMGSPYWFEASVTQGIVSGVGRSTPMIDPREAAGANTWISGDMVQTDAQVLQGNSGGPLVDAQGRVVAMNTRGYAPANAYDHATMINLSVASSTISRHIKEFLEFGDPYIQWAAIGASVANHEFEPQEQRHWNRRAGAKIKKVTDPTGPAAKAKLKAGDVIIGFRGKDIDHFHDLQLALDRWSIGQACDVQVIRGGKLMSAELTPKLKK